MKPVVYEFLQSMSQGGSFADYPWFVIIGGASHGALLAFLSLWFAVRLWNGHQLTRWFGLVMTGWVSGFAWMPLIATGGVQSDAPAFGVLNTIDSILEPIRTMVGWPLVLFSILVTVLVPEFRGSVGALYYFLLNIYHQLTARTLTRHLLMGVLSGCLGASLWWRLDWNWAPPWYTSLLHGTIWGSLVGLSVWKSQCQAMADGR